MASWGSRVVAEIVTRMRAAVTGDPDQADAKVRRFPTREGSGKQIGVYCLERATERSGESVKLALHRLRIAIEIRVEAIDSDGETSPGPDEVVDPLYVLAIQTLLADPTLGGLIRILEERKTTWKVIPGEKMTGVLQLDLDAFYQTRTSDPELRK